MQDIATIARQTKTQAKPLYKMVRDDLVSLISKGTYKKEDCLPSQAALVKKYNVSISTIRQSLNDLAKDGWVRAEHGKGFFVDCDGSPPQSGPLKTSYGFLCLHRVTDPVSILILNGASLHFNEINEVLAYKFLGVEPKLDCFRNTQNLENIIISGRVEGQCLKTIRDVSKQVVLTSYLKEEDALRDSISTVSPDPRLIGYTAPQLLIGSGHKEIGFVLEAFNQFTFAIIQNILDACKEQGVNLRLLKIAQPSDEEAEYLSSIGVKTNFFEDEKFLIDHIVSENSLTGVIVNGDQHACRIIYGLEARNFSVPKDKSVMSIGGLPRDILAFPDISRINVKLEKIGKEAAKILTSSSKDVSHVLLPVSLEAGKTIASPK